MNSNTGEITEVTPELDEILGDKSTDTVPKGVFPEADKAGPVKKSSVVRIAVGDIVGIKGVRGKVVHINAGKRRVTVKMMGNADLELQDRPE